MKTSELQGALLDYWVAKAEGFTKLDVEGVGQTWIRGNEIARDWCPSVDWAQGGPLIEKYKIDLTKIFHTWWALALTNGRGLEARGSTPLQAICRAVVRAVFGDEVPDA